MVGVATGLGPFQNSYGSNAGIDVGAFLTA